MIAPVEYVRKELLPRLSRGQLVVLSDAGHTDFIRLQPTAFELLASRFLDEGVVDTSGFEHHAIDFTPSETLQDLSQAVLTAR